MKRPQMVETIGNLLTVKGHGQLRELTPSDPPVSTLIVVDVEAIDYCDLNPRRQENPEFFVRLCESIRQSGLDHPIPITRRPGEARYLVAAGGNTRLKAFKHLRKETGEPRFAKVPCVFKPWVSEVELVAAHLRENDLRDDLVFIDQAVAVQMLRKRLEAETGRLTTTAYAEILRDIGHPKSRRDLDRMEFAVEWLEPVIPEVLRHGAGPRLVDRIGSLHRAYARYYEDLEESQRGTPFDPLFFDVLKAHDGEALNLDAVETDLVHRLSEATGIQDHRVRLGVDALRAVTARGSRYSDRLPPPPAPAEPPPVARDRPRRRDDRLPGDGAVPAATDGSAGEIPAGPAWEGPERPGRLDTPEPAIPAPGAGQESVPGSGHEGWGASAPEDLPDRLPGMADGGRLVAEAEAWESQTADWFAQAPSGGSAAPEPASAADAPEPEDAGSSPLDGYLNPAFEGGREHLPKAGDLKSLRSRVFVLATRLAQAGNVQDLVAADREAPTGFDLRPLPEAATERGTLIWWLLKALSGGEGFDFVPPSEHVFVYDPAAFVAEFLFRFDDGRPPPDGLLRNLFLLVEAIVALARAGDAGETLP